MRRFVETTLLTALMAVLCIAGCQKIETPNRSATPKGSNRPAVPDSSAAARVEKALAAADITLPEVATFLYSRGWTVIPNAMPEPHWRASAGASYHVVQLQFAIGDTIAKHYLPQTAGPYCVRVKGVSAAGVSGPWSLVGWSDNGDGANSLPGVRP